MCAIIRVRPYAMWFATFSAIVLLLAPIGAPAQYGNFQTATVPTGKDIKMMRKLVREDFTGKPKGTTLPWSNPVSHNSGTVTLLAEFPSQGRDCRRAKYLINPGPNQAPAAQPTTYVLTSCHLPDGSWKLDNQARPDKSN